MSPHSSSSRNVRYVCLIIGVYVRTCMLLRLQGPGPQSDEMVAETLIADPPPAANLWITDVKYTSVTLSWSFNRSSISPSSLYADSDPDSSSDPLDDMDKELLVDESISGYQIFYKSSKSGSSWEEKMLKPPPVNAVNAKKHNSMLSSQHHSITGVGGGVRQHFLPASSSSTSLLESSFTISELLCGTLYQVR